MLKFTSNLAKASFRTLKHQSRALHLTSIMPAKVGDKLPNVDLYDGKPDNKVNLHSLGAGKKIVIFGVPGAFTPGCSKTHLPGYVQQADDLKAKGVSEIICVAVNDPFVMAAWGEQHKAGGKVRCLADTNAALTKGLDLEIDLSGPLGSVRCKRFALCAEDNEIKFITVEPDGTGVNETVCEKIIQKV